MRSKLGHHEYWSLDLDYLHNYGIGNCRLGLAKKLRSNCYKLLQIILIILFGLLVVAHFVCHDVWYEERVQQYLVKADDYGES